VVALSSPMLQITADVPVSDVRHQYRSDTKGRYGSFCSWMYTGCAGKTEIMRKRAIPERLRGVIMTRFYTNPCLSYLILPHKANYKDSDQSRLGKEIL